MPLRLTDPGTTRNRLITLLLWILFYASFTLVSPPLLDDADSVHVEVAREMLLRHDWVTLYANGIRYLEKAPLLYWSMAASMKAFGVSAPAARLPLALTVLALALALESFARRAFDSTRAGLYASLITLSSFGIFIFTRITIPDAAVCLWITLAVYAYWRNTQLAAPSPLLCYTFAAACALNVLTKGLIGVVFPITIVLLHLLALDGPRNLLPDLRRLYPATSTLVFLVIAAPWHILAGLANPTEGHPATITFVHAAPASAHALSHLSALLHGHWLIPLPTDGNVHGWTWFYFVNEHLLRYLNLRVPRDYDTVPLLLFYGLVFIWLMPWSAFLLHALATVPWRRSLRSIMLRSPVLQRSTARPHPLVSSRDWLSSRDVLSLRSLFSPRSLFSLRSLFSPRSLLPPTPLLSSRSAAEGSASLPPHTAPPPTASPPLTPLDQTRLLLGLWAAVIMLFFSFSTRQEYYVLPALPALILLIAGWLNHEADEADTFTVPNPHLRSGQRIALTLFVLGSLASLTAIFFVLNSRTPQPNLDLAVLLKQNPDDYALSFGHFLDLNARAMGAFRTPLVITAIALFSSTLLSWRLRRDFRPHAANLALAAGAFLFLLAAHRGLRIFSPVLTSRQLAAALELQLKPPGSRFPDLIVINGEYESASTLGFYLNRPTAYTLTPDPALRPAAYTPTTSPSLPPAAYTPTASLFNSPATPQLCHPERSGEAAQSKDPETAHTAGTARTFSTPTYPPASQVQSTLCAEDPIHILNGRSSNLWYGSFFPDAPHIFEDDLSIQLLWTQDRRIFLWTEPGNVPKLPNRTYLIAESGDKEILSNQPNPF